MTPDTYCLDSPAPATVSQVLSAYNFREVAPEILSPYSWSLIGCGMERGFRDIARRFHLPVTDDHPAFVAYLGFRPYHVISEIERLVTRLPWMSVHDPWLVLLGGQRPAISEPKHSRWTAARRFIPGTVHELQMATAVAHTMASIASDVLALEANSLRATHKNVGQLIVRAGETIRAAWALHAQTAALAVGAATVLRRVATWYHDADSALELVRQHAKRDALSVGRSGEPGLLGSDSLYGSYELLPSPRLQALVGAGPSLEASTSTAATSVPALSLGGSVAGRAIDHCGAVLRTSLGEREQSKNLALRAHYVLRYLLERTGDTDDETLTVSSFDEHVNGGLDGREVHRRWADLERAARTTGYPTEILRRGYDITALRETATGDDQSCPGVALSPGTHTGTIGLEPGDVLVDDRVEAITVAALRPAAVVSRWGSPLSHLAMVARELGIPAVGGITLPAGTTRVFVDGYRGVVQVLDVAT